VATENPGSPQRCPRCGIFNLPDSSRCDCGARLSGEPSRQASFFRYVGFSPITATALAFLITYASQRFQLPWIAGAWFTALLTASITVATLGITWRALAVAVVGAALGNAAGNGLGFLSFYHMLQFLLVGAPAMVAGLGAGAAVWQLRKQREVLRSATLAAVLLMPFVLASIKAVEMAADLRRRNPAVIKQSLLEDAPVGSSMAAVAAAARRRGWNPIEAHDHGAEAKPHDGSRDRIGTKSIFVNAGSYAVVFTTHVEIHWGFDADGKLIDLVVYKDTDAL
jgi:hypothetical protein